MTREMIRQYMVFCELCEETATYFHLWPQEPITKRQAERRARREGWTKMSSLGWVHKKCVKEAADR